MDLRKYIKFRIKALAPQFQRPKTQAPVPFLGLTKFFHKFPAMKSSKPKIAPINFAPILGLQEGDLVKILFGKYTGHVGRVQRILKNNLVEVSGTEKKMVSLGPEWHGSTDPHVALKEEAIHVLNVVPLDPVLKRPTRIKIRRNFYGQKFRISKLSRCAMPDCRHLVKTSLRRAQQSLPVLRGDEAGQRTRTAQDTRKIGLSKNAALNLVRQKLRA